MRWWAWPARSILGEPFERIYYLPDGRPLRLVLERTRWRRSEAI